MKVLSVIEDESSIIVQSVDGILFFEEDWMKTKEASSFADVSSK